MMDQNSRAKAGEKIWGWVARCSRVYHRQLILGMVILGALCLWLISHLQFQSDVANLLPSHAPRTQAFVKFLKQFGASDSLFVILERKSGGEIDSFEPFGKILAEKLLATGELAQIQGWMDNASREKLEQLFIPKALLFLTEEDLQRLEEKLADGEIERHIRELKARLNSPLGSFTSQWMGYDPLDLLPIFRKYLPASPGGGEMDSTGIFISPDRKMMLLIAKPKGMAFDVAYDERLLEKLLAAEREAQEAFAKEKNVLPSSYFQDLQIGHAGGYMTALEDRRMLRKELLMNFSVSLIGVLALFFLAFRSGIAIVYAILPLMASPLLTIGFFSPFLGRLSETTGAFSAIILGLSIDFIILLYSRYLEERKAGEDLPRALEKSLTNTGPGIFTGAVTTVASYYALLFSSFRGVKELGLLTGTGILLSMVCAFFLFPALVVWREKNQKKESHWRGIFTFHLERISLLALKKPGWVFLFCIALTAGALVWAPQLRMNNDPKRFRPAGHSSLLLEARLQEKMEQGQETIIVLTRSSTEEEALEIQGKVQATLAKALASGLPISSFETLAGFLPPLFQQKRNLAWVQARENGPLSPNRIEKKLQTVLQQEGLRTEPFAPGLRVIRNILENRDILTPDIFHNSPLRGLEDRFLREEGGGFWAAAYVHIKPGFWANAKANAFLGDLKGMAPDIQVTGAKLVQTELEEIMAREAWIILLIALAAIFALLYFDFRSWSLSLISLLPVVLASVWTLGLMGCLKMDLNFMNLIVFTMVLGIGVDYGVHILHRGLENRGADWESGLLQVGKGVILAALTTLVGFGSLIFSKYPGLTSMGAVALMGVGFSALIALTLIPILISKWTR